MTEYTKGSRNRGPPTESHTGQRSKEVPTHPYSNGTDSPSMYSASRQEQSPQDLDLNFQIGHQYIMPLISTIKDQNMHLKHQRSQIETEMAHLHKISQMLLTQNQQLRKHYASRTSDIKKIIETISINAGQEINDINHQAFLLKESNCALVKEIQRLMKESQERGTSNQQKRQLLDDLSRKNVELEQASRDIQVKNKQLFLKCQQSKVQASKIQDSTQQSIVNQLLRDVTLLKNTNKQNLLKAKSTLTEHDQQKPALVDNFNSIVLKIHELGAEAKQMQQKTKNAENQLESKKENYSKSVSGLSQAKLECKRVVDNVNDIEKEKVEKKKIIEQGNGNIKKGQDKIKELLKEKIDLQKKVKAKRDAIKNHEWTHRKNIQKAQQNHKKQIKKIRQGINQQTNYTNKEIKQKIQPEITRITQSIDQSKQEYATLVQEVDDFRNNAAKLQNPLKQIIRMEYELKKRGIKK